MEFKQYVDWKCDIWQMNLLSTQSYILSLQKKGLYVKEYMLSPTNDCLK